MMNIHVVISGKIETVCFIDERVRKDNLNESHRSRAELAASRRQASRGLYNRRYGHVYTKREAGVESNHNQGRSVLYCPTY